jgi:hypothetical protein
VVRALAIAACVLAGGLLPGCTVNRQYTQTELNAIETREFDYGYDQTYDAAIGALFDLGYAVGASDKRGGLIRAGNVQLKLDQAGPRRTAVRVSTSMGGQVQVDQKVINKVLGQIESRLTAAAPTTAKPGGR